MDQGVADLSIVVIKLLADESMVTCSRVQQAESGRKANGKGADTLTKGNQMY